MRTKSTKIWNVRFWFLSGEKIDGAGERSGQCAYIKLKDRNYVGIHFLNTL